MSQQARTMQKKDRMRLPAAIAMLLVLTTFSFVSLTATAAVCPFCSAVNLTMTEQIRGKDVAVFASLVQLPEAVEDPDLDSLPKATFEITRVIKGEKYVETGMKFQALIVGAYSVGDAFMVLGNNPPTVKWTMPMKSTPELVEYVTQIGALPVSGPERLKFIQGYFEHEQSILAFDAYDEFAGAAYEDMLKLQPYMDHDKLVEWIKDPEMLVNRRCLYLTMLGICGSEEDAPMLEGFIKSDNRRERAGLDALAACYLTLVGERGVDLLEEKYLANENAEYGDTTAIIGALRFIGTETDRVPTERIVQALRYCLDRPKVADTVVADLARWEDWTVMEKMVQLFKEAKDDANWIRTPVITYLRACPKEEAKQYIEELRKIDPDAVRRADFFIEFADDEFADVGDEIEDIEDLEPAPSDDAGETPAPDEAEPAGNQPTESVPAGSGGLSTTQNEIPVIVEPADDPDTALEQRVIGLDNTSAVATFTSAPANRTTTDHVVRKVPQDNEAAEQVPEVSNTAMADRVELTEESMADLAPENDIVASTTTAAPVAAIEPANLLGKVIFLPMVVSLVIFLVLWSVLHGWFERLIF